MKYANNEELVDACAKWQKALRLQDWKLAVRIARGNGLDLPPDTQGRCEWTLGRKEALIRILDPVDFPLDCSWPQDMEVTLVHELLHLHFAPFDDFEGLKDTLSEQAINAISHALVEVSRK